MASGQKYHHPGKKSANLALPPPMVQVPEVPRCHPQSSPSNRLCWKSVHLMKNHLTHSVSTAICILHRPGLAAPGKRSPCSCNSQRLISLICFPCRAPRVWGTFNLVLNFSSTLFYASGLVGLWKYLSYNSARMAWQTWGMNLQMVVWPTSQLYSKEV